MPSLCLQSGYHFAWVLARLERLKLFGIRQVVTLRRATVNWNLRTLFGLQAARTLIVRARYRVEVVHSFVQGTHVRVTSAYLAEGTPFSLGSGRLLFSLDKLGPSVGPTSDSKDSASSGRDNNSTHNHRLPSALCHRLDVFVQEQ